MKESWWEALLLNNLKATNTDSNSDHFASFNAGKMCRTTTNIPKLAVGHSVLTWEEGTVKERNDAIREVGLSQIYWMPIR